MSGKRRRRKFLFPAVFVLILVLALAGVRLVLTALYPLQYEELIDRYSKENGLSPAFVYGVIHTESRFRADAVSPIGARGLMQITEETFEWTQWRMGDTVTAYDDLFDPETNIRYGTRLLSLLLDEFGGEAEALAAYHAGWGSVKRWLSDAEHSADGIVLDNIPFTDTAWYVPKVLKTAGVYRRLYNK